MIADQFLYRCTEKSSSMRHSERSEESLCGLNRRKVRFFGTQRASVHRERIDGVLIFLAAD
jgi:hypothetical protein